MKKITLLVAVMVGFGVSTFGDAWTYNMTGLLTAPELSVQTGEGTGWLLSVVDASYTPEAPAALPGLVNDSINLNNSGNLVIGPWLMDTPVEELTTIKYIVYNSTTLPGAAPYWYIESSSFQLPDLTGPLGPGDSDVAQSNFSFSGKSWSQVVPEPATIGLMGVAGLGMFLARRKTRR